VVPGATPVTKPEALTVATLVWDDAQVIVRPVSAVPPASLATADSCKVSSATIDGDGADTDTVATGTVTVISAVPLFPSLVAVMDAVPPDTAVTSPELLTVACEGADDVHSTVFPESA
jgi:hypothetical protein